MCAAIFSTNLSETFLILRRNERDVIINAYWSLYKASVTLVRLKKKLDFSRLILEKYSNVKLHENPSSGSRNIPCAQKDGRSGRDGPADVAKLTVAFGNFAYAPKK
jgi:hypothetical protein